MIKEYIESKNIYGKTKTFAVIICDSCKTEFKTTITNANQGRRYCSMECVANARNFHLKDIIRTNEQRTNYETTT